jgi:hypothetical protein
MLISGDIEVALAVRVQVRERLEDRFVGALKHRAMPVHAAALAGSVCR